jgi:ATP-dependent protease ClpP protease subunit
MTKPIIDLDGIPLSARNFAPRALGPGFVRVSAADDKTGEAEITVYGDIGGWWDGVNANDFVRDIEALDAYADTVNVRINSPGGSVFDGIAMYNAIAQLKARTVGHVESLAASIASVVLMGCDERRIGEAANVMVHKPWTIIAGNADDLVKEAGVLNTLENGLVNIYAARTGAKREDIAAWLAAETWLLGQDAVDKGFADVMVPAKGKDGKKAALTYARSAMLPLFRHTPKDLLPPESDVPEIRAFEALLRDAEGFSHTQAKRIAAMARVLNTGPRDESRSIAAAPAAAPAAAAPAAAPPRDEGATELKRLAAFIKSATTA